MSMAPFKEFKQPLLSELRKAERAANKATGTNNCKVTGWSWDGSYTTIGDYESCMEWVTVKCEICHDGETRADVDVFLNINMHDRRRATALAL